MGCGTAVNVVRADSAGAGEPEDEFVFRMRHAEYIRTTPAKFLLELCVDVAGESTERITHLNVQTNYNMLIARIGKHRFSVFGVERSETGIVFKVISETEKFAKYEQRVRF